VDDSRMDPVATGSVANSSDGLGYTLLVEGNGGPLLSIGESETTYTDVDIAPFGDVDTAHIPSASSEANEAFNIEDYIYLEGNGDGR